MNNWLNEWTINQLIYIIHCEVAMCESVINLKNIEQNKNFLYWNAETLCAESMKIKRLKRTERIFKNREPIRHWLRVKLVTNEAK